MFPATTSASSNQELDNVLAFKPADNRKIQSNSETASIVQVPSRRTCQQWLSSTTRLSASAWALQAQLQKAAGGCKSRSSWPKIDLLGVNVDLNRDFPNYHSHSSQASNATMAKATNTQNSQNYASDTRPSGTRRKLQNPKGQNECSECKQQNWSPRFKESKATTLTANCGSSDHSFLQKQRGSKFTAVNFP